MGEPGADMMVRTQIQALVQNITAYDALEQAHIEATLAWIESGAPLCRIAKPDVPPQHLVAYFLLVDPPQRQVLLVDHKLAGLWLPNGGHVEPGEHPAATVCRELREELNLAVSFLWPNPIFLTMTQTVGATSGHVDVSLWYVLNGDSKAGIDFDAGEFHNVAWFALDRVPLAHADPHLGRFLDKLTGRLPNLSAAP